MWQPLVADVPRKWLVISITCHLCMLLFYIILFYLPNNHDKRQLKPKIDIPAYAYTSSVQPMMHLPTKSTNKPLKKLTAKDVTSAPALSTGLQHQDVTPSELAADDNTVDMPTTFAGIQPITEPNPYRQIAEKYKKMDPVHMLGEKVLDDPLRKLIGVALTRHLFYPKIAETLGIHGIATIGLFLHTDGRITDIELLKTSRHRALDTAALSAVQDASPIKNVDIYLHQDRRLIINIIFN